MLYCVESTYPENLKNTFPWLRDPASSRVGEFAQPMNNLLRDFVLILSSTSSIIKWQNRCFQPGSNRRPCACEAHVITTTLWKLSDASCLPETNFVNRCYFVTFLKMPHRSNPVLSSHNKFIILFKSTLKLLKSVKFSLFSLLLNVFAAIAKLLLCNKDRKFPVLCIPPAWSRG